MFHDTFSSFVTVRDTYVMSYAFRFFVNLALAFQTFVAKKMNLFSGGRGSKGTQSH